MAVGSTGVEERDGRTFGSQRVKMCVSVFATVIISVAVAEPQSIAVRNGDKVTLPCGQQLPNCRSIDWVFAGRSYQRILLVKNGEVSQQYVEEYGQLSLTSDCSLDIMKITEELVGLFTCRWKWRSDLHPDLNVILLSVVTLTRTENHQLSCYVTSQNACRHKVRWLYDGKPYSQPEPRYGCQHNVSMCQDCEESLQEDLFSCEVWRTASPDDVQLFTFIHQTEGYDATTPTLTTRWSSATGSTGNTGGNSEEPQPGGWWRHLVAVLLVVVVMCILVDFLLWKRAKGKKKLQEENTVELVVSYTKRGAKVRVQVTYGEDGGEAAPSGGAADESTLYCNVSMLDG